jgi:threonine/homoserine/homoserine lactone efflux protein
VSPEAWLTFLGVSIAIVLSPGPLAALAFSAGATRQRGVVMRVVAGVGLGDALAIAVSLAGLGALFTAWPEGARALTAMAALAVLVIGGMQLRSALHEAAGSAGATDAPGGFRAAFALAALHPGTLVLFSAFLAQFIDASRPWLAQAIALCSVFVALGVAAASCWVMAGWFAARYLTSPQARRNLRLVSAAVLLGFGLLSLWVALADAAP